MYYVISYACERTLSLCDSLFTIFQLTNWGMLTVCQKNPVTLRDNTNKGGSDSRVSICVCWLSTARPAHDKRTSVVYCLSFVCFLLGTYLARQFIHPSQIAHESKSDEMRRVNNYQRVNRGTSLHAPLLFTTQQHISQGQPVCDATGVNTGLAAKRLEGRMTYR
jgi:hypothetical protein